MRTVLTAAALLLALWVAVPAARAHRLDELLQATTLAVGKDRVAVQVRLSPGVAVRSAMLAELDPDGDGILSEAERRAYAARVQGDLALTLDNHRLTLRLVASTFPTVEQIREGLGDIRLHFEADVPPGGGPQRRLRFENHHHGEIAAYLVNCLAPADSDLRAVAQSRNFEQSSYQLDYTTPPIALGTGTPKQADPAGQRRVTFAAYFLHGVHHILTGYDHLLFVGALVLGATTRWDLVKVVTAFTLAHTLTLTLAALNLVHLPGRVVEPLIAASIVFVAAQNVLWPRRARGWSRLGAAFFFGLFHGLGFAGGLLEAMRELPGAAAMFLALLAFSCGVEAGHQMVVLPLFAALKAAGQSPRADDSQTLLPMTFQRIGSAGISVAGVYYLCLALTPPV